MAEGQVGQQRAAQHLQNPQDHPARPAGQHADPPAPGLARFFRGHEAQVVGLLAHLRDERDAHGERGTKQVPIEPHGGAGCTRVVHHIAECAGGVHGHGNERHHHHHQPQRLGPHLEAADDGDTVRHQRDDHQRTDEIAPGGRDVQREFERVGHDGGLQREEDEGERGVDQRGDGGADVAKARAAREQVHVHAVARGVHADGQAGQEDDEPGGQNRERGVDEAVLHQQRGAYRFEDQERGRAERGVGHAPFAPLAKALRRVAQRVVFHGLAADPAVVVAPDLDHLLRGLLGFMCSHARLCRLQRCGVSGGDRGGVRRHGQWRR